MMRRLSIPFDTCDGASAQEAGGSRAVWRRNSVLSLSTNAVQGIRMATLTMAVRRWGKLITTRPAVRLIRCSSGEVGVNGCVRWFWGSS